MEKLKAQRQTIKSALTRIANVVADQSSTAVEVRLRAERADELFKRYEDIQQEIDYLTSTGEQAHEEAYRVHIEEKYFRIKTLCAQILHEVESNNTVIDSRQSVSDISAAVQSLIEHQGTMSALIETIGRNASTPVVETNNPTHRQHELRLPHIQIPQFDGKCTEWIRFRDLFETLVHNRENISDVEKFEYLQTKMQGEALSLIKHLKPTNANYNVAWELLKRKYDKSDRVKKAYFELLFDQPSMKTASITEMKRIYNTTNESINALNVLEEPVQHWDSILLFLMEKKLDPDTLVLWYRGKKVDEASTFQQFLEFLERRVFELENTQRGSHNTGQGASSYKRSQSRAYAATVQSCPVCSKEHFLYNCNQFKEMDVEARRKIVQRSNACFNCLQLNHRASACKSTACRKCSAKHNTLLHLSTPTNRQQQGETTFVATKDTSTVSVNSARLSRPVALLPTAIVMVYDGYNNLQPCRALLDSGSQGTLILEACVQRLQLKRRYDKTVLYGVGSANGRCTRGRINLRIKALENNTIDAEALCLVNLTQNVPAYEVTHHNLNFLKGKQLADPSYFKPGRVDIILGADVFSECVLPEKLTHPSGSPAAISTIFGWVLLGNITAPSDTHLVTAHTFLDLSKQLQRFWEVEDLPGPDQHFTSEERSAEDHYQKTVQRDSSGRYIVRLPLKEDHLNLGDSRTAALKRLYAMERRFTNDDQLQSGYRSFMREYSDLGHMEPSISANLNRTFFLPHHAVMKPTSTTTKLRVVFDASCKTTSGASLNDKLLVGPTIQKDLFEIIVNFRKYEIAFSGDIEKMYRQVLVHPDDRSLQRIIWRDSKNEPPKEYNLKTVTYGTSAAPFLAIRTLHQVANDNEEDHPKAAKAIKQHFYVDDFMACNTDVRSSIELKNELCTILSKAGFHLRKWSSNSKSFMESIEEQDRELNSETIIDTTHTVKTLGLLWDTSRDCFKYSVNLPAVAQHITKRAVLSDIAKVFDPIGWLSPVVVTMKIFMQKLWVRGLGWDEKLSDDLYIEWVHYRQNINAIQQLRIPRWLEFSDETGVELHGFSDSSEMAYSATIYIRIPRANGEVRTNLIAAKTKVAPVKQVTLPRLELCAAYLMTKLMTKVRTSLNLTSAPVFGWTDSTIVLAWISDHPRRWKTFVANRTSQIINVIPAEQWRHIPSQANPADLATRGISPKELINSQLWWSGPSELRQLTTTSCEIPLLPEDTNLEERREIVSHIATVSEVDIFQRYSSYTRLLRVTALLLRFTVNCKVKRAALKKSACFLTTRELQHAHNVLIRKAQLASYAPEVRNLSQGKQLAAAHKLGSLCPFIDDNNMLRVGGRISNANVNYDQKHPLIIHKDHQLTKLIIEDYHHRYLHAGNRQLNYLLSLRYWIPGGTLAIKRCIFKCVVCMRQRGIPYQQQMGNIPQQRLDPGCAFLNTGVDFAGPIQVRSWKGRGSRLYKCWIAFFVCLVTKAVHIELVTELSTAAFIASLRRFIARRGKPIHIYSDNGTNFVGANQQLRDLYQLLHSSVTQCGISHELANQQIQWHFSPPSGPHFGGIWEAGIKSIKHHLRRTLGDALVTYEELQTVLCQIEFCLNSRPLCAKFIGDVDPLTPAHFLILRSPETIPEEDMLSLNENSLNRWQYIQRLVQQFWQRWSREYLTQLQQRPKWTHRLENLKIDDVVIIKDDNLPPSKWSIGRVTELHPGSDKLVRVVSLKTAKGSFKRPVVKLCPLSLDV